MPHISQAAQALPPSGIRKFFDLVASTEGVISLGVGEPDFFTPWALREAAIYSIEKGRTTYTSNYGLLELRERIAGHIFDHYQVEYDPAEEILATVGVSEGMDLAMRVILNPGDEVLVPQPCYVSYEPCVFMAGGVPVGIPTSPAEQFLPTLAQLEGALSRRTKAILLGYPSNPTGAIMPRKRIEEIVAFAQKHDLYLISDEIYDRLTYDGTHTCVSSVPGAKERTILLNGFSKAYAMTGWRLGYACAPRDVLAAMVKIHSYTIISAPIMAQRAGIEALKSGEPAVREMFDHYNRRRRLIVAGLSDIGLECHLPQGAFYAFPEIEVTGLTSEEFAEKLLFEEKVAVVPGTAFGMGGEGHVRCSYATSIDKIETALVRMRRFVDKYRDARTSHSTLARTVAGAAR
ncbi:MAG: aminotransferase class I/II-fold pyridoxal phosphate-dependent enzyme [Capsulimonadaceae bacterium]|nr:aminotransferase class I/II-fold pyridoxal phosphate-dependent enzyme [Capsulimonadaceae bacterium]